MITFGPLDGQSLDGDAKLIASMDGDLLVSWGRIIKTVSIIGREKWEGKGIKNNAQDLWK
jgi:hypothetical protein